MKTNFALVAMVKTDDPLKGNVVHLCLYENYPQQSDVDSLIHELATDEEFGMIGKVIDVDYFLQDFTGEALQQIKDDIGIPDDLEGSGELPVNETQKVN